MGKPINSREFYHIKDLISEDKKPGSKIARVAYIVDRSNQTVRTIDDYPTFEAYQLRRRGSKPLAPKVTAIEQVYSRRLNGIESINKRQDRMFNMVWLALIVVVVLIAISWN